MDLMTDPQPNPHPQMWTASWQLAGAGLIAIDPACHVLQQLNVIPMVCDVCGCTDWEACEPDGCSWVALSLCSACAPAPDLSDLALPL